MRTYIADIVPKLQKFSEKLDNQTLLTNQHWIAIDNIQNSKTVYIFRANNELLISTNGKVEKAKWEYLGNRSLLIDRKEESYLFRHGFFDENVLALKVDSKDEYAFLVNENNHDKEINSVERVVEFLQTKYLSSNLQEQIEVSSGLLLDRQKVTINIKDVGTESSNLESSINNESKVVTNFNFGPELFFWLITLIIIAIVFYIVVSP